MRFTHSSSIDHQLASSRHYQGKCRYTCCSYRAAFCYFSQCLASARPSIIASFVCSSLSHQAAHTLARIHRFILILLHTYTHIYLSREHGQAKREKLTPYTRFQSVCRPSLREASNRMIITVRLFVRYLYFLSSIPVIHSSVHIAQETDETHALLFSVYVLRVCAFAYSFTSEQTCSLAPRHASHFEVIVVVVVAMAVAICEDRRTKERREREERMHSVSDQQ